MKTKASILIVEDDSVIASVEEWRLKKMGYTICGRAANGIDALAQVKEKNPDLVLLDINL
jgi:response regulator of citrate/malate metabolism